MDYDNNNNSSGQSRFNYALSILQRVDFLQFKASELFRSGDLDSWFYEWKNIKNQLSGRFSPEDHKELFKLEKKIGLFLNKKGRNENQNSTMCFLIEKYLTFIQSKMEEWGAGLVSVKDESIFT